MGYRLAAGRGGASGAGGGGTPSPTRRRILVTGGAGFVGANLAVALARRYPGDEIVAFDNLKRRGSELNLPRLRDASVSFLHGDVRSLPDLLGLDPVDAIVECSAEPSVLSGLTSGIEYLIRTNLLGAYHSLELARRDGAQIIFLSTSRVYPIEALSSLRYDEGSLRFELAAQQVTPGASDAGISEEFPLVGARSLYGATKLASELLAEEYRASFGVPTVVDRCGIIAGPWQMGKIDQGVFAHWVLSHYLARDLAYIGYGGTGKQVRDLAHIEDLVELIDLQLADPQHWAGATVNVGGGLDVSLSLREATEICRELTGRSVRVASIADTRPGDVPIYISDCTRLAGYTNWRPERSARRVLEDIFLWLQDNEQAVLRALL
jgi:CDP-paratose 2-epimerase